MEPEQTTQVEARQIEPSAAGRQVADAARVGRLLPDETGDLVRVASGERLTRLVLQLGRDGLTRVAIVRVANAWRDPAEVGFRRFEEVLDRRSTDDVASMLLTVYVGRRMMAASDPLHRRVWGHALRCAMIARQVAPLDEAFTAYQALLTGMFHDIGILGLLNYGPERYRDLVRLAGATLVGLDNLERARLGVFHPDVGVAMVQELGMPEPIVRAIAGHHDEPPHRPEGALLDVVEALDLNASVGMPSPDAARSVSDAGMVDTVEVDWLAGALDRGLEQAGAVARVVALENA